MKTQPNTLRTWGTIGLVAMALALLPIAAADLTISSDTETSSDLDVAADAHPGITEDTSVKDACLAFHAEADGVASGSVRLHFGALTESAALIRTQTDSLHDDGEVIAILAAGSGTYIDSQVEAGASYQYILGVNADACVVDVTVPEEEGSDGDAQDADGDKTDPANESGGQGDDDHANESPSDGSAPQERSGGSEATSSSGGGSQANVELASCQEGHVESMVFAAGGHAFDTLGERDLSGTQVSAIVDAEGCQEVDVTLLSFDGDGRFDVDAGSLTEGHLTLSVDVPVCIHAVVLVEGQVDAAIQSADALLASQNHVLAQVQAGQECPGQNEKAPEPSCSGTIDAFTIDDGTIRIEASDLESQADLMRSTGGEPSTKIATLGPGNDTFTDTDLVHGQVYEYGLVVDGELCDSVEVTAVPVFPTVVAAVLGIGVSLLGYIGYRRL